MNAPWPVLPGDKLLPFAGKLAFPSYADLPADWVFHLVSASDCGFVPGYLVKLDQRNTQEFASSGIYKDGGSNPVTWSLQNFLSPLSGVSSLPKATLFSLMLSYSFRFADCKSAQVSRNAVEYAMMSLKARPKLFQDKALRLNSRNLCCRAHSSQARWEGRRTAQFGS